jgi:tetratricopeptide (TPR) repeat protein
MRKNIFLIVFILCAVLLPRAVFSSDPMVKYLCELGRAFYHMEKYDEALAQFRKALLLDPNNRTAKKYIDDIFTKASGRRVKTKPAPVINPEPKAKPVPIAKSVPDKSATTKPLPAKQPAPVKEESVHQAAPSAQKTSAYKVSLQRLILEAQKNIQKIDDQMRRQESKPKPEQSVSKEDVMEKQLAAAESRKK